jgi:hypothetical protein
MKGTCHVYISNRHTTILWIRFLTSEASLLPDRSSSRAGPLSKMLLIKCGTVIGGVVFSHCMKTAISRENTHSRNESRKSSPVNATLTHVQMYSRLKNASHRLLLRVDRHFVALRGNCVTFIVTASSLRLCQCVGIISGARITQWYSAGLRAGWSGFRVPSGAEDFSIHHRVQIGSGAHTACYPMGTRGSFPGISGRRVKLATRLHLVSRSRMRGDIPPLPNTPPWRGAPFGGNYVMLLDSHMTDNFSVNFGTFTVIRSLSHRSVDWYEPHADKTYEFNQKSNETSHLPPDRIGDQSNLCFNKNSVFLITRRRGLQFEAAQPPWSRMQVYLHVFHAP